MRIETIFTIIVFLTWFPSAGENLLVCLRRLLPARTVLRTEHYRRARLRGSGGEKLCLGTVVSLPLFSRVKNCIATEWGGQQHPQTGVCWDVASSLWRSLEWWRPESLIFHMHTNLSSPLSFLSTPPPPPPANLGENPNVKPLPKAIFLKTICLYINPQETFRLCKGFHIGLHKTSSVGDELGQGWCPAGMTIHEYMLDEDAKRWHGCWCPPCRCVWETVCGCTKAGDLRGTNSWNHWEWRFGLYLKPSGETAEKSPSPVPLLISQEAVACLLISSSSQPSSDDCSPAALSLLKSAIQINLPKHPRVIFALNDAWLKKHTCWLVLPSPHSLPWFAKHLWAHHYLRVAAAW